MSAIPPRVCHQRVSRGSIDISASHSHPDGCLRGNHLSLGSAYCNRHGVDLVRSVANHDSEVPTVCAWRREDGVIPIRTAPELRHAAAGRKPYSLEVRIGPNHLRARAHDDLMIAIEQVLHGDLDEWLRRDPRHPSSKAQRSCHHPNAYDAFHSSLRAPLEPHYFTMTVPVCAWAFTPEMCTAYL